MKQSCHPHNYNFMDLYDSLKNIKNISPDSEYSAKSRGIILQTTPLPYKRDPLRVFRWVGESLQFGSAIALTGLLLMLVVGGFSILSRFLTLNDLAALNINEIQAEAQNVDMQIELASLSYDDPAAASTSPASLATIQKKLGATKSPASSSESGELMEAALMELSE